MPAVGAAASAAHSVVRAAGREPSRPTAPGGPPTRGDDRWPGHTALERAGCVRSAAGDGVDGPPPRARGPWPAPPPTPVGGCAGADAEPPRVHPAWAPERGAGAPSRLDGRAWDRPPAAYGAPDWAAAGTPAKRPCAPRAAAPGGYPPASVAAVPAAAGGGDGGRGLFPPPPHGVQQPPRPPPPPTAVGVSTAVGPTHRASSSLSLPLPPPSRGADASPMTVASSGGGPQPPPPP